MRNRKPTQKRNVVLVPLSSESSAMFSVFWAQIRAPARRRRRRAFKSPEDGRHTRPGLPAAAEPRAIVIVMRARRCSWRCKGTRTVNPSERGSRRRPKHESNNNIAFDTRCSWRRTRGTYTRTTIITIYIMYNIIIIMRFRSKPMSRGNHLRIGASRSIWRATRTIP